MSDLMRLAGINSGYDSEAMIEKMLQTYQAKIDSQSKKLTKLSWKQDAYRDVINKLTTFKNKYFDILKRDNYLLSPTTFKKFKSTITNKSNPDKVGGISVTTTSSSIAGSHNIKISQTATAAKLTGNVLRSNNFELDLNSAMNHSDYTVEEIENEDGTITKCRNYNYALDIKVGDVTKSVTFGVSIDEDENGEIDADAFASALKDTLNGVLEEAFGFTGRTIDGTVEGEVGEPEEGSGDGDAEEGTPVDNRERFMSVEVGDDGKLHFLVGGNATVSVTENTGNFGMARSTKGIYIAAQSCVTGTNTVCVTANGVSKNVSFQGVSETYFDTRDEEGNEEILKEYTELKKEAFKKAYKRNATDEELEQFSYSSIQAAKDKNSKELESALNEAFKSEDVSFTIDSQGNLIGSEEFSITSIEGGTLGITKASASNKISTSSSLKDLGIAETDEDVTFTINGTEISVKSSASLDSLIKAVNSSNAGVTMTYSNLEGRLIVTSNDMGDSGAVKIEANKFTAALGLADDEETAKTADKGRNSIIELDGVEIYHNSNKYTFDGTTIDFTEAEAGSEYTVGITRSYDDVKNTIKDFVKDYNQLIDDIYDYITTAPKRDNKNNLYEPLTDEEKAEMSEKEIEKWEDAAKEGILYNDSTISSIMSNLRMVLYNSVETADGGRFNLVSMGITTMKYKDNAYGKLEIDEEAFDKAFDEHADEIMKLFTDTETGIMGKVNNVLDNAVRTTGNVKGSLIRKAGLKDSSTSKDNEIYRQMEAINKRIKSLQDRYNAKENYWWNVFTNLEKMMAKMNEQSSYLANYFGYTGNYQ